MAIPWSFKCLFRLDAPKLSNISKSKYPNISKSIPKLTILVNVELLAVWAPPLLHLGQEIIFPMSSQILTCQNGVAVHGICRINFKVISKCKEGEVHLPVSTRATVYNSAQYWKHLIFHLHIPVKYVSVTHKQLEP